MREEDLRYSVTKPRVGKLMHDDIDKRAIACEEG
jgi:hypothetical protein